MSIRFFKVEEIDASRGQMRLKVWVRLRWVDQRLSWNPEDYDNVTQAVFYGGGMTDKENSEIWVPDLTLYNANMGVQTSLDKTLPIAAPDGSMLWSRPGILDTLCKFSGLVAFPFDTLKCAMEWGGWSYSDGFQGISLEGDGYEFLDIEASAGSSYQEYVIQSVSAEAKTTVYPSTQEEPWTLVKYTVALERADFYYSMLIIMPTVLVTYLSFGAFFLSHQVGERLAFGITLLLVVEVMRTGVASYVPICGELLWVDLFMMLNTVFCYLSLLETMVVLTLAFTQNATWLAWLPTHRFGPKGLKMPFQSEAGNIYRRLNGALTDSVKRNSLTSIAGEALSETDTAKLIFFEKIFYSIDSDANGSISLEDACCMLSYVNLDMSRKTLEHFMAEHWPGHERLACSDFLEVCVELMWMKPFQEIKMGAENYNSSYLRHSKLCSTFWLGWSKTVDRWSRFLFPTVYTCLLAVLGNLELTDEYEGQTQAMFQGIGPVSMSAMGVFQSLLAPFSCITVLLFWIYMKRLSWQKARVQPAEENIRPVVPRWTVMPDRAPDLEYGDKQEGSRRFVQESLELD
eukprot:Skav221919  [mRNA]  locus=scaffold5163:65683:67398:- [translate_table: standard]